MSNAEVRIVSEGDPKLNSLLNLYHRVDDYLKRYAKLANRIENLVLALSVVTSGALWLLAAQVIPQQITWAGAAVSTFVTGLTIYMYASGINARRKKALLLYGELGQFIAEYRRDPNLEDYWERLKNFEFRIRGLAYSKEDF